MSVESCRLDEVSTRESLTKAISTSNSIIKSVKITQVLLRVKRHSWALFLFCSCAFSKFFLEWGREADGTRGTLEGGGGEWRGISFIAFICCWLEAICPTHSGLTDNTAYICCLYLLILHNAYDAGYCIMLMMLEVYDLGWMDGMLNTRAISMQGSDCAPWLAGLLCGVLNWGWGLWGTDSDGMEGQAENCRG